MSRLATDPNRTIALFLNDFDQEFADALEKLSKHLRRPLHGMILLDKWVKAEGRNVVDKKGQFETIVCDFSSDVALKELVAPMESQLLFVTCSSERNQPFLKKLLPFVPELLGPTESSLDWSTHKAEMRRLLESYDASLVPKTFVIDAFSDLAVQAASEELQFPVIIKPTGLAASMLVSKAHDKQELKKLLRHGFRVVDSIYSRDTGRGKPGFIIEEFIEGDMYSLDAYVNNTGTVWSLPLLRSKTADTQGKPGFYVYQADSYVELTAREKANGQATAKQAIHALGLRSCVAHVELFHTKSGWKIVELGPRAGGLRQDVYFASYGVDHAYNEFLVKIGLEPELPTKQVAYSTTVNIYPDTEGVITKIEGFDTARQNPSMYRLIQQAKPGDTALLSTNGGKLIIRGVMCNVDRTQLEKDAAFVRSILKVHTKPLVPSQQTKTGATHE